MGDAAAGIQLGQDSALDKVGAAVDAAGGRRQAPFKNILSCRVCGGSLVRILDLGWHPLPDFTQRSAEAALAVPVAPLVLTRCEACGLVQLAHTVDRSVLFGDNYPYKSGMNQTVRDHLQGIVQQALSLVQLNEGDVALDIGSNDGTLLSLYPKGPIVVGVEPSVRLAKEARAKGIPTFHDFFPGSCYLGKKAKVITSIAMFYDLEDPLTFCKAVKDNLHTDGVWVNEFNYLPAMLRNMAFDQIGHEHLCYYDFQAILSLYEQVGLEVFHVETNTMNGGSLRVLAGWPGRHAWAPSVGSQRGLFQLSLAALAGGVRLATADLVRRIQKLVEAGNQVWIRGASTRGLTLLHTAGLNERLLVAAGDRNPEKWGCYIPGTGIQIRSEAEANAQADYQLILPYTYTAEIMSRSQEFLRRGGKFIVPVPEVRVLP